MTACDEKDFPADELPPPDYDELMAAFAEHPDAEAGE